MPNFTKIIYSPRYFDIAFGIIAVLMLIGIFKTVGLGMPAITASEDPVIKGLTAVAVFIAAITLAFFTTNIDQKCADDFLFLALAKSALIAIMGTIFAVAFWLLLMQKTFGPMPTITILMVVVGGWTLAYFGIRWKGTVA